MSDETNIVIYAAISKAIKAWKTEQNIILAKRYFEEALAEYPTDFSTNMFFALFLEDIGKYEDAISYYKKTININSGSTVGYLYIARVQAFNLGDFKNAEINLKLAITFEPKSPNLLSELANIYVLKKEYKKAEDSYKKAISIDSSYSEAYYGSAKLYAYHIKDEEKTKYNFTKAIELQPEKDELRDELADIINWNMKTFISKININNIHGLKNKQIKIKEKNPAHLFITGDNGFFKTSILESIRNYMQSIVDLNIDELSDIEKLKMILSTEKQDTNLSFNGNDFNNGKIGNADFKNIADLKVKYESGLFIFAYFPAHRLLGTRRVKSVEKISLKRKYKPDDSLRNDLLPFLIDLDYTNASAHRDNDEKIIEETNNWFKKFNSLLKKIFDDSNLTLKKDKKIVILDEGGITEHTFTIKTKKHEPFDFMELAHGYNSILSIISELILRSTKLNKNINEFTHIADLEGIVLIDEPEAHLHIKLQKLIMPMLTEFFPKIQFIAATHSPFVLNSLSNAVIYDVKTEQRLVDVSDIPANKLSDNYFNLNREDISKIQKKIKEFEKLIDKFKNKNTNEKDESQLAKLDIEIDKIIPYLSSDLYKRFKENQKYLYE